MSDLGKIYVAIPWDDLVSVFKIQESNKGTKNYFSPKGKLALMKELNLKAPFTKHREQQLRLARIITKERATRLEGSFRKEKEHYHLKNDKGQDREN